MTQTEKIISAYESSYLYATFYNTIIKNHKDEMDEERLEYYCDKAAIHEHASRVLIGLLSAGLIRKYIPGAKKWANSTAKDMYETWLKYR